MYLIFSEAPSKLVATAVDQFPDSAAQGFETGALLNQHDYFHNDHDEDFHVDHNDSIGFSLGGNVFTWNLSWSKTSRFNLRHVRRGSSKSSLLNSWKFIFTRCPGKSYTKVFLTEPTNPCLLSWTQGEPASPINHGGLPWCSSTANLTIIYQRWHPQWSEESARKGKDTLVLVQEHNYVQVDGLS